MLLFPQVDHKTVGQQLMDANLVLGLIPCVLYHFVMAIIITKSEAALRLGYKLIILHMCVNVS